MEDVERYLGALKHSAAIAKKLGELLEDDKMNIGKGLSGEAEAIYKSHCDEATEQVNKIRKTANRLYSESSTGII
ncbi:MAG: hypothetical protein IKF49_06905 [Clostridia bacterium]|nr:hypothetical protein [Clostridia bacterium]